MSYVVSLFAILYLISVGAITVSAYFDDDPAKPWYWPIVGFVFPFVSVMVATEDVGRGVARRQIAKTKKRLDELERRGFRR